MCCWLVPSMLKFDVVNEIVGEVEGRYRQIQKKTEKRVGLYSRLVKTGALISYMLCLKHRNNATQYKK